MNIAGNIFRRIVSVSAIVILAVIFGLIAVQSANAQASIPTAPEPVPAKGAGWPPAVEDNRVIAHVLFDQLEGRASSSGNLLRWDGQGWIGTDMNRLWLKSEGFAGEGTVSDGDHEVLYDRPIPHMRYFDAQAGVRADVDSGPARVWAAIGMEGLAPYFFDFEPTFYVRDGGHIAGRINGSWDLFITQRCVVQPQAELNFYSKDDPARQTGSGLSDIDTGVRIRYELTRKFNPYVGWAYDGKYGGSARYTRQSREATSNSSFVFGLRVWY
jgi:copper resistance protein B